MNSRVQILAMAMLTLSVSIFLAEIPVRANNAPSPLSPGTQWVPSGPMIDKLQFQVYSDSTAEFNDFQSTVSGSGLDIVDSPVPPALLGSLQGDTRFLVTGAASQSDIFGIDFNMTNTFWGVGFNHGSDPRGLQIRQGIAHLINKNDFIVKVLSGFGSKADCFAPKLQGLPCPGPLDPSSPANGNIPAWNVCSWDPLFPKNYNSCQSAYNFGSQSDLQGAVTVGSNDFCAAADHFIAAGLATGKNPQTATTDPCVLTGPLVDPAKNPINFCVRTDDPAMHTLGVALSGIVDALMGHTAAVTLVPITLGDFSSMLSFSVSAVPSVAFPSAEVPLSSIPPFPCTGGNWNMMTDGWSMSQAFDQSYGFYNNERFLVWNAYSDATFNHWTDMLEFNTTLTKAQQSAQAAEYLMGANVVNLPIWSDSSPFAYRSGWSNVVQQVGGGVANYWTALNAWNPSPSTPGVIHWGLRERTLSLNIFTALSLWDRSVLDEIYDSLVISNPYSPYDLIGRMANQFVVQQGPTQGDPAGTVQDLIVNLRNNMFFHDGVQVTASDVKFSLLALGGGALDIIDVTVLNDFNFRVNLAHMSAPIFNGGTIPLALFNVGTVPIIPQKKWAADTSANCVTKGTLACSVDTRFLSGPLADPVSNFRLIGSGPFVCVGLPASSLPGGIGGGCTSSGTANVDAGGTIVLQRYGLGFAGAFNRQSYFRDSANYKLWQWADVFGRGTVDLIDTGSAKGCTNLPASTAGCAHWDTPAARVSCVSIAGSCNSGSLIPYGGNSDGLVQTIEVSQAFGQSGLSWTFPMPYTLLTGAQPIPQTLYEGGITYAPCIATPPQC